MSFIPATSNRDMVAVLAVVAVAMIAMFMRRGSKDSGATGGGAPPGPLADAPTEPEDDDNDEAAEVVAVTSDGWAFMPDGDEVQLVPPPDAPGGGEETDPTESLNPTAMLPHARHRHLPIAKPGEHLDAGDFIGARVVRGSPGSDPWRLEALGQDGEYRSWAFETPEAAEAALRLIKTSIVRPPLDDEGTPRPPGADQYAAAAALTEEGIADLAMDTGDDTPEGMHTR